MQLTEHFALHEFERDGAAVPEECVPVFRALCEKLLEPLRVHFGEAIVITSGYRSPDTNAAAHGVKNSQHVATAVYCAADWNIPSREADLRAVFDLIRNSSALEFDQLILEHDPRTGTDVIHSSWSRAFNRRIALAGETANAAAYKSWPAAAIAG